MAESLREKWNEFREEYNELKAGPRTVAGHRMTRFERDYGSDGPYRMSTHEIDESSGSECLDD